CAPTENWLVSIAGGDQTKGKGKILIADITVGKRKFRIAGGWGVRRSRQGEQEISGTAGETVLHRLDAIRLNDPWKSAFLPIEGVSDFKRATLNGLRTSSDRCIKQNT